MKAEVQGKEIPQGCLSTLFKPGRYHFRALASEFVPFLAQALCPDPAPYVYQRSVPFRNGRKLTSWANDMSDAEGRSVFGE